MQSLINSISIANLLTWLVLGLIVGIIIHYIDPQDVKGGIIGTVITGVLGAIVGGFLANLILGIGITGLNLTSILIVLGGALLLALIQRILFRNTEHIKTKITRLK